MQLQGQFYSVCKSTLQLDVKEQLGGKPLLHWPIDGGVEGCEHTLWQKLISCVFFFFNEDNQFKCICLSGSSLATTMMSSWGLKQSNQLADYLWPHNCYSFTMCFGWVSTYIQGLVSMPMILRQPVIGLLTAASAIFNFHFRFWCSSHIAILLAVGA